MTKPLYWRPLARQDADSLADWYARQGGLPLEDAFIAALEAGARLIARHPGSGSTRHAALFPDLPVPLRFMPLKRFDRVLIYYLEHAGHVEIVRVWNAARDIPADLSPADLPSPLPREPKDPA
ncbi:MAG: type II toxin-antitoxin system RelE/ParE family toxin [Gammaproteobacteria bacterium]